MRNIWRVFTRDWRRILAVPQAWIIVVGIIVTPALYAWVNVIAFWDPYGATGNISVAVANLDEGASSDLTGAVDVGAEVVAQLEENDQRGWTFVDTADEARERVESGQSYAALIIPQDFSANLLSITTSNFTQPKLEYLVNEKASAVAPKITDVGAAQVQEQITSSFTAVVAQAAAEALKQAGEDAENELTQAQTEALGALDDVTSSLQNATGSLDQLQEDLGSARESAAGADSTLTDVDSALAAAADSIRASQQLAQDAAEQLSQLTSAAAAAYADGLSQLATIAGQSQAGIDSLTEAAESANGHVADAIDLLQQVVDANAQVLAQLQALADDSSLDPSVTALLDDALAQLTDRNTADEALLEDLQQLNSDSSGTVASLDDAASALNDALTQAQSQAGGLQDIVATQLPELAGQLAELSGSATGMAAALEAQRAQVAQAQQLLAALDEQLASTVTAVGDLADTLSGLQEGLGNVRTDVAALGSASLWNDLENLTALDAQQIADFMASPVEVREEVVFPISTYGSAMAALFTNLSLWIGAFVLMVILKLEVDGEGVPGLTVRQGYLGRWLFLAVISALQGLLVTAGNLIIGVQTVNAVAFMFTGMLIALAYLSIIYALSVSFTFIGKGLCVVLVIVQIPGASGLYPIEMMPDFFRRLYPFFPFTYGIDAMRETISGFYDGHYWQRMAVLAVFVAGAFTLGLVLRPHLGTLNGMVNRNIAATDLLLAEEVPDSSGYRLSQVLRSLANRDEYHRRLQRRARTFARHYPRLRRGGLIAGILVPVVLVLVPSDNPSVKALLLGLWVAWFLLLFAYLITVEYIRDAIDDGLEISNMPDADLHTAIISHRRLLRGARARDARAGQEER